MSKMKIKYYIVLFIIFSIGINVPYSTTEPYSDIEFYTVMEPYTDIEYTNYTITESYIGDVPLNYTVVDAQYMNYVSEPPSYLWIKIKNTDEKSGNFDVYFYTTTSAGGAIPAISIISAFGNYIPAGETKTVKISFNDTFDKFTYEVIPSTKEVMKYRNITKQKTETKYRNVQKPRGVIRLKEVKMSLLQRILKTV